MSSRISQGDCEPPEDRKSPVKRMQATLDQAPVEGIV